MNEKQQILIRIFCSIVISFLMFLTFSAKDGLFAFIIFLILIQGIDLLYLVIKRNFKIFIFSLIWYIILTSFYYTFIDSGFRIF